MKLRNIAIAAATVAAALSANAAGLSSADQAKLTASMTAGNYVSIAGASAVQAGFEALKGIDGGPHKRWMMWINSMQREQPYLPLTCLEGP